MSSRSKADITNGSHPRRDSQLAVLGSAIVPFAGNTRLPRTTDEGMTLSGRQGSTGSGSKVATFTGEHPREATPKMESGRDTGAITERVLKIFTARRPVQYQSSEAQGKRPDSTR